MCRYRQGAGTVREAPRLKPTCGQRLGWLPRVSCPAVAACPLPQTEGALFGVVSYSCQWDLRNQANLPSPPHCPLSTGV